MNHQTISGFRRDDTLRQRKFNRVVARRALGFARPYRKELSASFWW